MRHWCLTVLVPLLAMAGCKGGERPVFKLLSPEATGVTFANSITTSDSLNVQTDVYVYNGAGVAVGDINDDGLPDLFFSGNMVSSRLYLNQGGMRFRDITESAGVTTTRWATGASMVDINNDGRLDIYVSVSGPEWSKSQDRANALFINNGNQTFTEAASQYGIADTGFTTHSAFLDYDRDGCLDLFVLNNSPADFSRGEAVRHPTGMKGETPGSYNQLYRNSCPGTFTNVSDKAGILRVAGYGLGVAVGDLNADGWPDIYVSNDATPNDVLYINNRDGTFSDRAAQSLKHASFAGMGVDIADFNNDGWPDIVQADMLPRDLTRRKRMSGFLSYHRQLESRGRGFRDDFSVNALQLSNGVSAAGDVIFSDVAHLAGVAATDWSWSTLFADFDNDGHKDLFISNGYPKAVNDLDYQTAMFSLRRSVGTSRAGLEMLRALPGYAETNYVFRNDGDLRFSDKSKAWGLDQAGFSYGAAYADLNNDGRLDLVVSRIDAPALIYENVARNDDDAHHYLQLRLEGAAPRQRTAGVGATLTVTAGGRKQHLYVSPYRGYMSSMDERVQFGLGTARRVDSLEVVWPDGRRQVLTNLEADRQIILKYADATCHPEPLAGRKEPLASHSERSEESAVPARGKLREGSAVARGRLREGSAVQGPELQILRRCATQDDGALEFPNRFFTRLDATRAPAYRHETGNLVDYSVQALLPYMVSRQGPAVATADVDGDSLDDVFVGGSAGSAGQLFLQKRDGGFVAATSQPWSQDKGREDWGALFFDANGDKLPDLYVASGGYQMAPSSSLLQDRLYINRGGGRFARDSAALPVMLTSTATVRAGDFTGDGRPDLFVGGRLTPRSYPVPTRSYLLRNEGGRFVDVTAELVPALATPGGMITDAALFDFNGDQRVDLVTVGEWMPIQFFRNDGRRFTDVTGSTRLPATRGWWRSLSVGDFDKDGDPDLVAGNLGLNSWYVASGDTTVGIYAASFTGNQNTDIILTQKTGGKEQTVPGLATLSKEIYTIGLKFQTYGSFAQAQVEQAFSRAQLQRAVHYEADTFASISLRNNGDGTFSATPLPNLAQIAPIRGAVVHDVDRDGNLDLIVAGNLYDAEPNTPRPDAGNGLWLRGDGQGRFSPVPPVQSGFLAPLNVTGLALLQTSAGKAVLVANSGDSLQAFLIRK